MNHHMQSNYQSSQGTKLRKPGNAEPMPPSGKVYFRAAEAWNSVPGEEMHMLQLHLAAREKCDAGQSAQKSQS